MAMGRGRRSASTRQQPPPPARRDRFLHPASSGSHTHLRFGCHCVACRRSDETITVKNARKFGRYLGCNIVRSRQMTVP